MDTWITGQDGDPVFMVVAEPSDSLADELRRLLPQLRQVVGAGRRVTVCFDQGGFRAACSRHRAERAETSTDKPSRSATVPSVPVPGPGSGPSCWLVHSAGISRLLPSGSSSISSRRPSRRIQPSTRSSRPSSGCRA